MADFDDQDEYEDLVYGKGAAALAAAREAAGDEAFDAAVRSRPEVMECYLMSGEADYMLRVVVEDLGQYQKLVLDHLTRIPGVANIRSSFALGQVKYTTALPLGHLTR